MSGHRDEWETDDRAVFTYSLGYDPHSEICARLHHRSGEVVTILRLEDPDGWSNEFDTLAERAESGVLVGYMVRFEDGSEDFAFEDELTEVER